MAKTPHKQIISSSPFVPKTKLQTRSRRRRSRPNQKIEFLSKSILHASVLSTLVMSSLWHCCASFSVCTIASKYVTKSTMRKNRQDSFHHIIRQYGVEIRKKRSLVVPKLGIQNLCRNEAKTVLFAKNKAQDESNKPSGKIKKNQKEKKKGNKLNKNKTKATNSNKNKNKNSNKNKNRNNKDSSKTNILALLSNPYKAGKQFRQTIDSALNFNPRKLPPERRAIYYLDDRLSNSGGGLYGAERNPLFDRTSMESFSGIDGVGGDGYVPEVLVVGATGEIGRLVVKRLLLNGRFRVRVLVRDLYSRTLNMLGTGVTYCQGDLSDIESLEYAVTDVDKIVFCAGAPKKDESDFENRMKEYVKETLVMNDIDDAKSKGRESDIKTDEKESDDFKKLDDEFRNFSDNIELRSRLSEKVDSIGMQNLVRAYQNVRHADYGTSQAAKRSLFKFQSREEDFGLFSIDFDAEDEGLPPNQKYESESNDMDLNDMWNDYEQENNDNYPERDPVNPTYDDIDSYYDNNRDEYIEEFDENHNYMDETYKAGKSTSLQLDASSNSESFSKSKIKPRFIEPTSKQQVSWIKNKFNHAVFLGRIPSSPNGIAGVVSSRLRSREDPDSGIDLSGSGFAGFVVRLCSDGKTYEAFIRTGDTEQLGVEYVCKFSTASKTPNAGNRSANKFITVRLPFSQFVLTRRSSSRNSATTNFQNQQFKAFDGKDVQQIGFRIRASDNLQQVMTGNKIKKKNLIKFYISLCYLKVYRSQPEPEFVYLSDARIPPVVKQNMIRDDLKQIVTISNDDEHENSSPIATIFDDKEIDRIMKNPKDRSGEETFFKYRGEEILKHSGLSYAIVRIAGLNEIPSGEFSTIQLQQTNDSLTPVSRAEVADVCVSALLDQNACNTCFYMTKAKPGQISVKIDEKMHEKFMHLRPDE